MPKVSFAKNSKIIEVEAGSNLMQALVDNGIPVASSCKGQLVCGKCAIEVVDNSFHLSRPSEDERDMAEIKELKPNQRFACACQIEGDITVDAPYW